jgi:ABC-type Mn2+/Zn2+ transport system ATPase subunit
VLVVTSADAALAVNGLGVRFGRREVLAGVSFAIGRGELVGVVGPNGAGKSTLFRAICGLVDHRGEVVIGGVRCHHHRDRMSTAFIPQRAALDPDFPITVGELVESGRRRFRRWWCRSSAPDRRATEAALATVHLTGRERDPVGILSGGQLQRALLARALAQDADILLLDETLAGIDAPTTAELLALFRRIVDEGRTLLVATHDLAVARRSFDRCLALNGRLVADGPPTRVLAGAALEATFGSGPVPDATETGEAVVGATP